MTTKSMRCPICGEKGAVAMDKVDRDGDIHHTIECSNPNWKHYLNWNKRVDAE